jgi:hypothetical protein
MKPQFVWIGNRIVHLANVQYIEVQSPNLVTVWLVPDKEIQFVNEDAQALIAVLEDGYMTHILTQRAGARS